MNEDQLKSLVINVVGSDAIFYGYPGDDYFDNLQNYSAQNEVLQHTLKTLPKDAVVIDVGANLGVTSLIACRMVPRVNVVAIEPSPKAFACLVKNISINELMGINAINCALSACEGAMQFVESEFLAGSHLAETTHDGIGISVQCKTLDSLVDELQLGKVNLVKIDVEGYELDVLRGAENTINRFRPKFVIEFNSFAISVNRLGSPFELLIYLLERFGAFKFYQDGKEISVSTVKEAKDFLYQNMVCRGCVQDILFQ